MKILLRLVTVWLGALLLPPVVFLAWHFVSVAPPTTMKSVVATSVLVLVLIAYVVVGLFGIHRLWHLKESGRRTTLGILAVLLLLFLLGALQRRTIAGVAVPLLLTGTAVAILVSPSARRLCA
jgi:hypothetical protein